MRPPAAGGSVVVASFRPRALVEACLASLEPACRELNLELVVARAGGAEEPWLAQRPGVRLVPVAAGASVPVLRGAGLAAATGDPVLLTEDHCVADPAWAARMVAAAREDESGVFGGGMGNARAARALDWAAYFSEYGFFSSARPPEPGHPLVTGANVAYRRRVVGEVAAWMQAGEWENVVHDRLAARGVRFRFLPEARVLQNQTYRFGAFCRDRFQHGRSYARRRLAEEPGANRWLRLLATPLLAPVLLRRVAAAARGEDPAAFRRALPMTAAFLGAWAAGEAAGYLAGPAEAA